VPVAAKMPHATGCERLLDVYSVVVTSKIVVSHVTEDYLENRFQHAKMFCKIPENVCNVFGTVTTALSTAGWATGAHDARQSIVIRVGLYCVIYWLHTG